MKLAPISQIILAATFVPAITLSSSFVLAQNNHQSVLVAQSRGAAVKSGNFVKGEAPTTGGVKIVKINGQHFLEIDGAFSTTDQAPDLHVVLDPSATPGKNYSNQNSFVNLGKLQNVKGAQRYPIPSAVDISRFKSVVIWCRMANANIGYAALK
jgi:hypothetical protein